MEVIVCPGTTTAADDQSVVLEDGSRVSKLVGKDGELRTKLFDDVSTAYEAFERGCRISGDREFLGQRSGPAPDFAFEWMTYNEVKAKVEKLSAGLVKLGMEPQKHVGMFSRNRPEFQISQLACFRQAAVLIPLYDTLGPEAIVHILKQADLNLVIVSGDKLKNLLDQAESAACMKTIVSLDEVTEEQVKAAGDVGIKLFNYEDVMKSGEESAQECKLPTPDDTAVVCYTSGTTGNPKGVVLTHKCLVADVTGACLALGAAMPFDENLVHISYLPLAHMFEQLNEMFITWYGGRIGFFRGDPKLLIEDIQTLKPNYLPVVPRILNRLYGKVMDGVNQAGFIKRFLFNTGLNSKLSYLKRGETRQDTMWDSIVFAKFRNLLGGRVQCAVTGAAPCSAEVLSFMRAALGCPVFQGYGQSECTAAATCSLVGDGEPGHVGPPMACSKVKLFSVPEMNYLAENNEGEVCFQGPNLFSGYLHDEAKTKEAIDEDGWLHSGDIGRWNPNGTLSIIDRKKNIFKLAQGEYIAPEKIEMIYQQVGFVGQVFVHGDSLETALLGFIVPDDAVAARWATDHSEETAMEAVCKNEQFKQDIMKEIHALGKEKGLKGFEQVKALHLHPEPFTVEDNLLTPTMKMKRPQLRTRFATEIQAMYADLKAQ
ncbi:long-chain-fatty-acid--CoA ligase 1-like [Sycon ciliatum]|uniref:long-chain-fatty-acid--CoA ligase 1-like n=1 Tax=Sycon ciliatum TaxID=27933 RepID=UPI0020AED389|eukprot:scpid18960/ scgid22070/ Long-chain-fatty-acid--CoA ligase 1; Long-chain acyl-CoA synthetase 1; Palmitoyl-CoA ligase